VRAPPWTRRKSKKPPPRFPKDLFQLCGGEHQPWATSTTIVAHCHKRQYARVVQPTRIYQHMRNGSSRSEFPNHLHMPTCRPQTAARKAFVLGADLCGYAASLSHIIAVHSQRQRANESPWYPNAAARERQRSICHAANQRGGSALEAASHRHASSRQARIFSSPSPS